MKRRTQPVRWRPLGKSRRLAPTNNRRNGIVSAQAGFMLLEVVFAAGIVAIAMVALIESLTRCIATARSVQSYSTAQTLLANKSYEFRVEQPLDYADINGKFDDYPGYTWERQFDSTDTEGLWKQTITVSWRERSQTISDSVTEYRYLPDKQR